MSVWHFANQSLSFQGTAAQPGHIGADAGFIDEDKMFKIKRRLVLMPTAPRHFDVQTILLGGVMVT
jgi:hypothetical protein